MLTRRNSAALITCSILWTPACVISSEPTYGTTLAAVAPEASCLPACFEAEAAECPCDLDLSCSSDCDCDWDCPEPGAGSSPEPLPESREDRDAVRGSARASSDNPMELRSGERLEATVSPGLDRWYGVDVGDSGSFEASVFDLTGALRARVYGPDDALRIEATIQGQGLAIGLTGIEKGRYRIRLRAAGGDVSYRIERD